MTESAPQAGWFTDPADAALLRWWNGTGWTDNVHDPAPLPTPVATVVSRAVESASFVPSFTPVEPVPVVATMSPSLDASDYGGSHTVPRVEPAPTFAPGFTQTYTPAYVPAGYAPAPFGEPIVEEPWGSPHTLPAWFFAFAPIWFLGGFWGFNNLIRFLPPGIVMILGFGVMSMVLVLLARVDGKRLMSRGFRATSPWWAILLPVYLIIRTTRVGRRGLAQLVTFVVVQLAVWGLLFAIIAQVVGAVVGGGYSGTPTYSGQGTGADSSQADSEVPVLQQRHFEIVINQAQREYELTPAGTVATIMDDAEAQGFSVSGMRCSPLPSTAQGAEAQCYGVLNGDESTFLIHVNATRTDAAFDYSVLTP